MTIRPGRRLKSFPRRQTLGPICDVKAEAIEKKKATQSTFELRLYQLNQYFVILSEKDRVLSSNCLYCKTPRLRTT